MDDAVGDPETRQGLALDIQEEVFRFDPPLFSARQIVQEDINGVLPQGDNACFSSLAG